MGIFVNKSIFVTLVTLDLHFENKLDSDTFIEFIIENSIKVL